MQGCKDYEVIEGIHVHRVGVKGDISSIYRRGRYILSAVKKAREINKKTPFNIIHAHIFAGSLAGAIAGRELDLPIVTTIHGLYSKLWDKIIEKTFFPKQMEKFIIKLPYDKIIAVSQVTANQVKDLGVPPEKVEVIPNGVNLEKFNPKVKSIKKNLGIKEDRIVAFFGRVWKVKGVEYLVKAVPLVVNKISNVKFLIVGEGPQKESLMKLAEDLGISEHVMFHAPIDYPKMPAYIKASYCVVLPSLMEGLPVTALEAMACGVPVVATRVGGTPEVVKDGENGFLLKPGRPELIAEKVIQLLKDEKMRKRMGEAGRKFVEKFDWDIIANRTLEVYQKAIEKG